MISVAPLPNLDEARLQTFLEKQQQIEAGNIGAHDKAILTLASAALALSLTFSKDLVPFATADILWVLLLSWLLFVATLTVHILGYVLALRGSRAHQLLGILIWRHGTARASDLESLMQRHSRIIYRFNIGQAFTFLGAMGLLALYVGVNVWHQAHPAPPSVHPSAVHAPAAPGSTKAQPTGASSAQPAVTGGPIAR